MIGPAVLVLSCGDRRLRAPLDAFLAAKGLERNCLRVVLAGAPAGALASSQPDWNRAFWKMLRHACRRHALRKVVVVDHRDCETYRAVYGLALAELPYLEAELKCVQLARLAAAIGGRHPDLIVECYLMSLHGVFEEIVCQ